MKVLATRKVKAKKCRYGQGFFSWNRVRCLVHGKACPADMIHSHSVGEPKEFYCPEACTIGECAKAEPCTS